MDAIATKLERPSPADQRVIAWLDRFDDALRHHDSAAAAALFATTCFWRDLVAFTWNIVTLEGRDAIRTMLETQLQSVAPGSWTLEEAASETDGVTEAWVAFETTSLRGRGFLRLKGDEAWTLLTAARELKGFEEPSGARREKGVLHGPEQGRRAGWARRAATRCPR